MWSGLTTRKKLVRSLKSSSIIFIVSFFSSRFFLSDIAFVLHHPTWQSDTERSSDSMRSDWRQDLAKGRGRHPVRAVSHQRMVGEKLSSIASPSFSCAFIL